MNLGVVEFPGAANNPRIVMYHSTTMGGAAPDETAWCSSFVNYCVEQAGLHGTRSKAARSWHDQSWGNDVTSNPGEGDIVVFSRHGPTQDGGHVGFYLSQDDNSIQVLGGNQGNRVSIARYPKDGMLGSTRYQSAAAERNWRSPPGRLVVAIVARHAKQRYDRLTLVSWHGPRLG